MSKSKKSRNDSDTAETDVSASDESEIEQNNDESDASGQETIGIEETETETEAESECGDTVESLQGQVAEMDDELLRRKADFENFRKRMFRERDEAAKYANAKLLLDLVEVIDNFDLAIKSSEESQNFTSFHEGIELIEKQFLNMLENKYGLKRFDSEGGEFDPEKHEAIAVDQNGEHDTQMVAEVYQNGYMLHERVLRHAKVKVAMPSSEEPQTETGDTDTTTE